MRLLHAAPDIAAYGAAHVIRVPFALLYMLFVQAVCHCCFVAAVFACSYRNYAEDHIEANTKKLLGETKASLLSVKEAHVFNANHYHGSLA